jgi:hypothetical protein
MIDLKHDLPTIVPLGEGALVFNTLPIDVRVADSLRKAFSTELDEPPRSGRATRRRTAGICSSLRAGVVALAWLARAAGGLVSG